MVDDLANGMLPNGLTEEGEEPGVWAGGSTVFGLASSQASQRPQEVVFQGRGGCGPSLR